MQGIFKQAGLAPVSVIMPTYNRETYIAEAIESVLTQTRPPRQVIVVNDGSTDGTAEVVARYGDRVQIVNKENGGKSTALNLALTMVTEPYVWIFDDDDVAVPDALDMLITALESDPEADVAYGLIDRFFGEWTGEATQPCIGYQSDDGRMLYLKMMQDFFIWQGAMLVKREAYAAVGDFDVRFSRSQDYEMALRLLRHHKAVAVPQVMFHQRHHRGSRGPGHARFDACNVEAVWTKFNRLLFGTIYDTHDLAEFVVGAATGDLTPRERLTALVQRGAIMARKGVWDNATKDMEAAADLASEIGSIRPNPQEISALQAVFEHGSRSQFPSLSTARRFRKAIRKFDDKTSAVLFGNMMLPVTNRLRLLPTRPNKWQEFVQTVYILSCLFGPKTITQYLAARDSNNRHYGVTPLSPDGVRTSYTLENAR